MKINKRTMKVEKTLKIWLLAIVMVAVTTVPGWSYDSKGLDVKIGAHIEMDYQFKTEDITTTTEEKTANWKTSDIDLNISAKINESTDVFLKLDLDDATTLKPHLQNGLVEEIGFNFKVSGAEGLKFKVGKQEVPFGADWDMAITDAYTHNSGTGYISDRNKIAHPGEIDNRFGVNAIYVANEIKVEAMIFQDDGGSQETKTSGDIEMNDPGTSGAVRLTYKQKGLGEARVSYALQRDDRDLTTVDNATSISLAIKATPIEQLMIFGEYIIGSDIGNTKDNDVDVFQIGAKYNITDQIHGLVVYDAIDSDLATASDFSKILFVGGYKMQSGVLFQAEYGIETEEQGSGLPDLDANVFSLRSKYSF